MRGTTAAIFGLAMIGCPTVEPELTPTSVSQSGGDELRLRIPAAQGAAIVLVDRVAASSVVVIAPGVVQARLPTLPRTGSVDVEVLLEDDVVVRLPGALDVVAPELKVRARD